MKSNLLVLAGTATIVASACSFTPREQAEGKFEYLEVGLQQQVEPAPNKKLPTPSNRFNVPEANQTGPVGKIVPVLAPTLVWPLANGSRLEESEQGAHIYFDEIEGMSNVGQYVWQGALQALRLRNVGIVEQQERQRIVTDWLEESFTHGEDDDNVTIRRRIALNFETAEHGRTTTIRSEVVEQQIDAENNVEVTPTYLAFRDQNAATAALNMVVSEIAITQMAGVAAVDDDGTVAVDMGFDEDGYASIVLGASFGFTWGLMQEVLPELGFEVDDYNRELGRYYTIYGVKKSFWFSRNVDGKLELPRGDYEIKVTGDQKQTTVTLFRDGNPLSAAQVMQIFAPFAAEIRSQSSL